MKRRQVLGAAAAGAAIGLAPAGIARAAGPDRGKRRNVVLLVMIAYLLLADRKIVLDLAPDAVDWLADKGYDPAYGARPLKRVMQKELQDPLAEKILGGDIRDGQAVKVTAGSDRLNFRPKPALAEAAAA